MKYSFIVAIENYCDSKISRVFYSENDATEFAHAIEKIGYMTTESIILINTSATKTMIEAKLKQLSRLVTKDDQVIFYYAGHGFAENGHNYITCYDTLNDDGVSTSIQIQTVFDLLKNSCNNVLFFFDSCHSGSTIDSKMRSMITDMNKDEFIESLKDKTYCIGFASCKSDEYSYPASSLNHGAWTYHLIESINGNALDALEKGKLLTAHSLQSYLSRAVPLTLKKQYTTPKVQSPWIFGGSETDVLIGDLTDIIRNNTAPSPNITDIEFIMEKIGGIKSLSGFKKSHSIPDNKTHSTEIFVHTISSEELQDETQNISDRIKTSFGYKRKDISLSESDGQKSLLTPDFVIHVSINQSDENCREFVKIIRLTEISNKEIIKSEKFDSAFNGVFNSLIIRLDSTINIEKLIDDIEEVQDDELELHYPVNLAYCDLEVANIPGKIRVFSDEIVIDFIRETSPRVMLSSIFSVNDKMKRLKCETLLIE